MRDARDWRDEGGFEVRSPRISELRTPNFELQIAPLPLVAPFSHISRLAVMEKGKEKPKPKMRVSAFPEGETC
jgi:hypothetical protein